MRGWVALAMLVGACGGGGGGPDVEGPPLSEGQGPDLPQRDYWPLQVGHQWVHRDPLSGEQTHSRVTGAELFEGRNVVRVRSVAYSPPSYQLEESQVSETLYESAATGLMQLPLPSNDPLTRSVGALSLYRLPLRAGASFRQIDKRLDGLLDLDGDGRTDRMQIVSTVVVVGLARVDVPAGSFEGALHLRTEFTQAATLSRDGRTVEVNGVNEDWLAPDVGPVRNELRVTANGFTETSVRELQHFRTALRNSDAAPPVVVAVSPVPGALQGTASFVEAVFSEPVDPTTVAGAFGLYDAQGQRVAGSIPHLSATGLGFGFIPAQSLPSGEYEARLSTDLADRVGNRLPQAHVWRFTIDATPPSVVSVLPIDGATRVPIDTTVRLTFTEELQGYSEVELIGENGGSFSSELSLQDNMLLIDPRIPLQRGHRYQVRVAAYVRDLQGNTMLAPFVSHFTTDPGLFAPPDSIAADGANSAIGDVNGDGRGDIVVNLRTPTSGAFFAHGLFVRLQQPDGSLGPLTDLGWSSGSAICSGAQPVIGDLNGDGRQDVALSDGACGVQVFLQDANGALVPGVRLGETGRRLRIIDFDGDGRRDLVGMRDAQALQYWRGDANGNLVAQPDVPTGVVEGFYNEQFEVADLNSDGRADLTLIGIVGFDWTNRVVLALRQNADGSFAPADRRAVVGTTLAVGDANGDGRTDLLVATDTTLELLPQGSDGSLGSAVRMTTLDVTPSALMLLHIDDDGRIDLIASQFGGFGMAVMLGRAGGGWSAPETYDSGQVFNARAVSTGDANGDGKLDVLIDGQLMRQLARPIASAARPIASPLRWIGAGVPR
jgi:hypothetical protein